MRPRTVAYFATVVTCVTILLASSYAALAQQTTDEAKSIADLAAAARQAKGQFRVLDQSDVEKAKKDLLEAVQRLKDRLARAGDNGRQWAEYLQVGQLESQLQSSARPDLPRLTKVLARYDAGHEGLELVWFLDTRRALHNYLATAAGVGNEALRGEYEKRIDSLAKSLEILATKPTTEGSLQVTEAVRWLDQAHQAPKLVQAIQQRLVHANVVAHLSPALLAASAAGPVDDSRQVHDCILGTDVHGTAHTTGHTTVELPSDPNFGIMDTLFFGTTRSSNIGYNGPVTIYSNSTTDLAARKRVWIDVASGLLSHEAVSRASTSVQINDIQSNKGRRMVERIAWKRAGQQHSEAECIASRHAEARLNAQMDEQALEPIDRINRDYVQKIYTPLSERNLFPGSVKASTTPEAITLVGLQGGGGKLAAPGNPPAVSPGADLTLQMHESAINNFVFDALAGRTAYEEKMQEAAKNSLGYLPEKMKGDEDGRPWAITFAPRQPVSVSFDDDRITITLRGVRYFKGSESYPAMNVSASYKIEAMPGGFKAVRDGEIQALPPDFVPGTPLDARRQVIRTLLIKRFAKVFEKEFLGKGIQLPSNWRNPGRLVPIQLLSREGWLVVAWKLQPAAEIQPVPTK